MFQLLSSTLRGSLSDTLMDKPLAIVVSWRRGGKGVTQAAMVRGTSYKPPELATRSSKKEYKSAAKRLFVVASALEDGPSIKVAMQQLLAQAGACHSRMLQDHLMVGE